MDRQTLQLLVLTPVLIPVLIVVPFGLACSESPSLGPGPDTQNSTYWSVGGDDVSEDTDTGGTSDVPATCDPFADPQDECGSGMDCDPSTNLCTEFGNLGLEEECDVQGVGDECEEGLICAEGKCRQVCDPMADPILNPEANGLCPESDVCALVDSSWGICLETCSLLSQDCQGDEACNRVSKFQGNAAACTLNLGVASDSEPCASDGDCLPGLLCTSQGLHSVTCAEMAASCCTFICDAEEFLCAGSEPSCYALGIEGQETAGYCGV